MKVHVASTKLRKSLLLWLVLSGLATASIHAELISVSASGTISKSNSPDTSIPVGSPWTLEITYDTAAPDLDFELAGRPVTTFGRFTNTGESPALRFLHYRAADYEVRIDDPKDFGESSEIRITLGSVNVMEINLDAPGFFSPLAGGPVSFQAEFLDGFQSDFVVIPPSVILNDALLTDTSIGLQSFQSAAVTLLPSAGGVISGGLSDMTSLSFVAVPEPATATAALIAALCVLLTRSSLRNVSTAGNKRKRRSSNER